MSGRLTLVAFLLVLSVPGIAAAQSGPRDPAALVQEGAKALDERRFGDALEAFTAASAIVPRDPSLRFGAGMAAFMLGRNADAQEWFEKAITLNPRYRGASEWLRSEEHTSELQSQSNLVCRLLLEKKKN